MEDKGLYAFLEYQNLIQMIFFHKEGYAKLVKKAATITDIKIRIMTDEYPMIEYQISSKEKPSEENWLELTANTLVVKKPEIIFFRVEDWSGKIQKLKKLVIEG